MELKFRAWDSEYKEMASFDKMQSAKRFAIAPELESDEFIVLPKHSNITLMQYTGLKDKNGKEIYKSDIVKVDKDIIELLSGEEISEVRYINGGFYAGEVFIGHLVDMYYVLRGEIIGNIYENPNLLKA